MPSWSLDTLGCSDIYSLSLSVLCNLFSILLKSSDPGLTSSSYSPVLQMCAVRDAEERSPSFPAVSFLALAISLGLLQLTPGNASSSWQCLEQRFHSHFDAWTDICGPSVVVQYPADKRLRWPVCTAYSSLHPQSRHKSCRGKLPCCKSHFFKAEVSAITSMVLCKLLVLALPHVSSPQQQNCCGLVPR